MGVHDWFAREPYWSLVQFQLQLQKIQKQEASLIKGPEVQFWLQVMGSSFSELSGVAWSSMAFLELLCQIQFWSYIFSFKSEL